MKPWHEQDEFWTTFAPMLFSDERWEAATEQVDQVVALASLRPGDVVCDLACGPGRHALTLARLGFSVVGVDRTRAYLDAARARAEEEGLPAEWVEADMREFRRPDSFDAVINLFTAFGYFEDPAEDMRTAENILASLRSGGRLVVDILGKEIVAGRFQPRDWRELPDGSFMLEERRIRRDWTWFENRWIHVKAGETKEFAMTLRIFSAAELRRLLLEAGFATVEVFGALDGRPYDHEARRLVVVAHKA